MNSTTAHNPERRAEAGADPRLRRRQQLDLAACAPGLPTWGQWTPVQGPHLKVVRRRFARNRTGVPGISYGSSSCRRKDGSLRRRTYFIVQLGRTTRKFCVETLGRHHAWRRAVQCRAAHELAIREINQSITQARKANTSTL